MLPEAVPTGEVTSGEGASTPPPPKAAPPLILEGDSFSPAWEGVEAPPLIFEGEFNALLSDNLYTVIFFIYLLVCLQYSNGDDEGDYNKKWHPRSLKPHE